MRPFAWRARCRRGAGGDGTRDGTGFAQRLVRELSAYLGRGKAFASGLPVIAIRLRALQELVRDGVTGLLFKPGNAAELAERMRWALGHADEMAEMGCRARAHYEAEFSAKRSYTQLMAIYEDAVDDVSRPLPRAVGCR